MRRQQMLLEIVEGECIECGMIGPLLVRGSVKLCESCEAEQAFH